MTETTTTPVRLGEAWPVWVKIGLLSFGGPAGQIALMQDEIVTRRGWVPGAAFDRGLGFAMMLPGPEAQQLATWLGWRMHGIAGGLVAGLAFILPGAALMILLAWLAASQGEVPLVAAIFAAIQPVVIAAVLQALRRIAGRALGSVAHWALAAAAFTGLALLGLPFPMIIAGAALAGLLLETDPPGEDTPAPRGLGRHLLRVVAVWAGLIAAVVVTVRLTLGPDPFDGLAELFLSAAFVTFGGAYALLPYVADRAVDAYGWLTAAQMLNGLAIAEATPGPLILVTTYAGFFAGWSAEGTAGAGVLTAALATFYTFAPSFMLILGFAPAVERIQRVAWARRALAGISAAVVGVVGNLAVWLGAAAFLPQGLEGGADWVKIALFAAAMVAVFRFRIGILPLVGAGLVGGPLLHWAGLL